MAITLALGLLGLCLGLKISSRLGAAFLCFSAVAVLHAVLEVGPGLLGRSAYSRRVAANLTHMAGGGQGSIPHMTAAAMTGLSLALLLHLLSEDRRALSQRRRMPKIRRA